MSIHRHLFLSSNSQTFKDFKDRAWACPDRRPGCGSVALSPVGQRRVLLERLGGQGGQLLQVRPGDLVTAEEREGRLRLCPQHNTPHRTAPHRTNTESEPFSDGWMK